MDNQVIATETCRECGGVMEGRKGEYRYTECGLDSVTLQDILVFHCTRCNDIAPEVPEAGILHRVIAIRLLLKRTLLTGSELRFLRKLNGYSIEEFCEVVGANKAVVSRWENNKPHGKTIDRTIRLLVCTRMLWEIAGQPQPILKNVTIQNLGKNVEETLKLIHSTKASAEEKYSISSEELANFGGSTGDTREASEVASSVN
jgi:transcriptional regulator with XRE-family HTH domain